MGPPHMAAVGATAPCSPSTPIPQVLPSSIVSSQFSWSSPVRMAPVLAVTLVSMSATASPFAFILITAIRFPRPGAHPRVRASAVVANKQFNFTVQKIQLIKTNENIPSILPVRADRRRRFDTGAPGDSPDQHPRQLRRD